MELYLHSPVHFMAWCIVKHRDNFTFTLPFYIYITKRFSDCGTTVFQVK